MLGYQKDFSCEGTELLKATLQGKVDFHNSCSTCRIIKLWTISSELQFSC